MLIGFSLFAGCGSNLDQSLATSNPSSSASVNPTIVYRAESFGRGEANSLMKELQARTLELGSIRGKASSTAIPFTVKAIYSRPGNSFEFHAADLKLVGDVSLAREVDPILSGLHAWPEHNFSGLAIWPAAEIAGTVPCGPGGEAVDDGMALTLQNTQTQDSFTFSGMDAPSGSNVTLTTNGFYIDSRTGILAGRGIGGTALFQSGWKAYFFRGIFADSFTGLEVSRTQLSFEPPATSNTVEIRSFVANPPTINPANQEQTVFTADVAQAGFTNPTLAWTMTPTINSGDGQIRARALVDPGGGGGDLGLPPAFSGTGDITSGLAHLTQSWDGKSSDGQILPSGSYNYILNVTVTGSDGQSQSATANTAVNLSGNSLLLVKNQGNVVGSSEDQVSPGPDGINRLLTVFPFRRPQQDNKITLEASSLNFANNADPSTVTLTLKSSQTNPASNVTLQRTGPGNYQLSDDQAATTFLLDQVVSQDPTLAGHAQTSYALGDAIDSKQLFTSLFQNFLDRGSGDAIYKPVRAPLGRYCLSKPAAGQPVSDELALATVSNVRSFGFEAVTATLDPANNPGLQLSAPLKAVLKVRHPANAAFLTAHGDHNGDIFLVGDTNGVFRLGNANLLPDDTAQLKTLVLNSCQVLDMHDYNNNYIGAKKQDTGQPLDAARIAPTDPVSQRYSPGQLWWKNTRGSNTVLLGYNFPAQGLTAAAAFTKYRDLLPQLSGQFSNRLEPVAWLAAHGLASNTLSSALAACAWDKDGYYFISFHPPLKQSFEPDPDRSTRVIEGYFRVPLDANGENVNVTFTSPPLEGGVEKLELPLPPRP